MEKQKISPQPELPPQLPCFESDTAYGLNQAQVQERKDLGLDNRAVKAESKTLGQIIKSNLFTYFNLIFAVLAVLVIAAGSIRSLTFLPVVIANLLIGIVQETRAQKILDQLTMLNVPKALVVREGRQMEVSAQELVRDDVVIFRSGDQICADALLLEGSLLVNESILTGEAEELRKGPGDDLLSGSFVVSGEAYARLEKVGAESYISRLTLEAKAQKRKSQSEMLRTLDRLVGIVGILIVPIGIFLFVQQFWFSGAGFSSAILSVVAAVVGMIPEGLYLLASLALVASVIRLANHRVLVHDMKCIEALARVDVLCVDKTGTITENQMQVQSVIPLSGFDPKEGQGLKSQISSLVAAMPEGNVTMTAMKAYFRTPGGQTKGQVFPFSSTYKYCAAQLDGESYVLGAPEFVLGQDYDSQKALIESYSSDGYRTVLFGKYQGTLDGQALTAPVVPLGLILLANPIRRDAPDTFRYFAQQGVSVKVISGDHPMTVSQVAQEAGIPGAEAYVDASTLETEEDLAAAAVTYTVFGRVTPEQKRQLVWALQKAGHTVGMTGDGVNDVLALKEADCSVAMASGCDAAAQVSQLVLLESDFSAMPEVVAEGRRVVNNIQRSASLFLVKNIFSFLMAVFSACFMLSYPLEPSQVSLISTFTIGIPGFFLALQPNRERITGKFLRNVLVKALPAGLTDFLAVGALVIFGQVFGVPERDISTACTMLLAIVGFMILYNISRPLNLHRRLVWLGCLVGLLACSIGLGDVFGITHMSAKCVMLFVVFAIATEPVLRYSTLAMEWLGRKLHWTKAKKA